jgi:hypothetical protein
MGSDIYNHLYPTHWAPGYVFFMEPTIVYVVEGSGATWAGLRILLYCLQQPSTTYYGTTALFSSYSRDTAVEPNGGHTVAYTATPL